MTSLHGRRPLSCALKAYHQPSPPLISVILTHSALRQRALMRGRRYSKDKMGLRWLSLGKGRWADLLSFGAATRLIRHFGLRGLLMLSELRYDIIRRRIYAWARRMRLRATPTLQEFTPPATKYLIFNIIIDTRILFDFMHFFIWQALHYVRDWSIYGLMI